MPTVTRQVASKLDLQAEVVEKFDPAEFGVLVVVIVTVVLEEEVVGELASVTVADTEPARAAR
jgi:hypothetical protein